MSLTIWFMYWLSPVKSEKSNENNDSSYFEY